MATLLETLNTTREETLAKHYKAATTELDEKLKEEPLKTTFHIYAGCVSKDVTHEIAYRINSGGAKATVCKTGLVSTQYYLNVEVTLPEYLVHPEEKKEEKKEEETEGEELKESVSEKEIKEETQNE